MNQRYCKIGTIRSKDNIIYNTSNLEKRYTTFIENAYNLMQTDAGMSDFFYHEANKIFNRLKKIKTL